jgi:hypothetical protein
MSSLWWNLLINIGHSKRYVSVKPLKVKMTDLCTNIQLVPRSKYTLSGIKTNQLMLYSEIFAVCSQIHTKHINTCTLCGQSVEFVNVKHGGTYSNQWNRKHVYNSYNLKNKLSLKFAFSYHIHVTEFSVTM